MAAAASPRLVRGQSRLRRVAAQVSTAGAALACDGGGKSQCTEAYACGAGVDVAGAVVDGVVALTLEANAVARRPS